MRLLAAGLLVAALLAIPLAAADNATTVGLSSPTDPRLSALTNSTTVPITVSLGVNTPFCTAADPAKVVLTVTKTGNVTATLDVASVTFTVPASVDAGAIPPSQPQDFHGNRDVNLTVVPTGPGPSTINVVASFDGKLPDCSGQPNPPDDTGTGFKPSHASINITTQSTFVNNTPVTSTPVTSTPSSSTPSSGTPSGSTPVASSPVDNGGTPQDTTPEAKKGFLGIPGPSVPLVVAGLVAVAVLARRK